MIGTAAAPVVIDVRRRASFAADNRMIVGAMLAHGTVMYDALYAGCRSLQGETHSWTPGAPR